jgi:hypothetical protein
MPYGDHSGDQPSAPRMMREPTSDELRAAMGLRPVGPVAPVVPDMDAERAALLKMLAVAAIPGGAQAGDPYTPLYQQYIADRWLYLLGVGGVS